MNEFSKTANQNIYGWKEIPNIKLTIHTVTNANSNTNYPTKTLYINALRNFKYVNSSTNSTLIFIAAVFNLDDYFYLKEVIERGLFSQASLEATQLFRNAITGEDEEKTYSTGTWTSIEMMNEYTSSEDVYGTTITLSR